MTLGQRLSVWRTAYNTANLPVGMTRPPDAVSKWIVITRAAVFSMTATSGLIGGLLAIGAARLDPAIQVDWGLLALAVIGLVVAHAANNMINDYFDLEGGVDTDEYVRALYAPHPILSGWVSKRQLAAAILIANAIDLGDPAVPGVAARAAGHRLRAGGPVHLGLLRRAADPAEAHRAGRAGRLRRVGPADGRRHVLRGHRPAPRLGLARVAAVRDPGDDRPVRQAHRQDRAPTRPRASTPCPSSWARRRARLVAQGLMIAFYPIVIGAALVGFIGPWVALVLLGIPRLVQVLRVFAKPRPETPPHSLRRLAAVVRGRGVRAHPASRRPADPGPAPERDPADPAALGLRASLEAALQVRPGCSTKGTAPPAQAHGRGCSVRRGTARARWLRPHRARRGGRALATSSAERRRRRSRPCTPGRSRLDSWNAGRRIREPGMLRP